MKDARTELDFLREFAERKSDAAFAELVRRHIDLVYSAALRQLGGDSHLSQALSVPFFWPKNGMNVPSTNHKGDTDMNILITGATSGIDPHFRLGCSAAPRTRSTVAITSGSAFGAGI